MSKSNIYESKWTDLVFENKNKEYGAYQLRQENAKTTVTALFMGLLLIASLGSISILINKFRIPEVIEPEIISCPFIPIDLHPNIVKPDEPKPIAPPQQSATAAPVSTQLTHPVIVAPSQASPEIAPNDQNRSAIDNTSPGTGTITNVMPSGGTGGGEAVQPTDIISDPIPAGALDKLPEFPGGMNKFYTYVGNNFNRPELDAEKTLRVYVSFVIEKDGSITDVMVKNDPGYGIGKEAIRVLKSIKTKWIPGILNGKAVRTAYNLPITIKTDTE